MYAIAILLLSTPSEPRCQAGIWYADDATASGRITDLRDWWDKLVTVGLAYGYYVNASNTWLIAKEIHRSTTEAAFVIHRLNSQRKANPIL